MLEAGDRLERNALAAVRGASPRSSTCSRSSGRSTSTRSCTGSFRAHLLEPGTDEDLVALRAELDARAAREGLDERTGRELLLRLRERRLRRDIEAEPDLARVKDQQAALARVRQAISELA